VDSFLRVYPEHQSLYFGYGSMTGAWLADCMLSCCLPFSTVAEGDEMGALLVEGKGAMGMQGIPGALLL
jgi:hypothetical protein